MLPFRLVYHPGYDLNLGEHVFPSRKFQMIRQRLLDEGFATEQDFVQPEAAREEELLLVHEAGWLKRLRTGTLSYMEILRLEIPYSRQMVEAFWLAAGGTILAARHALQDGAAYNVGGGFHHAFPGHGEGFCAIHDVAVGVRVLQREGRIRRAMVVDCDVHHGNGTAEIFGHDPSVFTLSIHQFNNYPSIKPPSSIDIDLEDGIGDEEYLQRLEPPLLQAVESFRPQLLMYVAGADPYRDDQLGGLSLTLNGLRRRDRLVIETAHRAGIPVVVTLAGGYAQDVNDTITIHCNTAKVTCEVLAGRRGGATS